MERAQDAARLNLVRAPGVRDPPQIGISVGLPPGFLCVAQSDKQVLVRKARAAKKNGLSPYRLELLPRVPAFHRRARRRKELSEGQLVYYGPMPVYYGIGEVKRVVENYVAVDFRGTGQFGVHEDVFEKQYLIPIPSATMNLL